MKKEISVIHELEVIGRRHGHTSTSSKMLSWLDAVNKYSGFHKTGILDIAVTAANLTYNLSTIEPSTYDPLAKRAIIETNPSFDFDNPPVGDQLKGALNAAKGKYFEYTVIERLNNGERVGDVILPEGYQAVMAGSLTQPGWDIKIISPDNSVSEYLQMKATDSISYVRSALEKYPDIRIVATDEVANSLTEEDMVLDSDISDQWLTDAVDATISHQESFLDLFLESFSPVMSLAVIAGTEGLQVMVSRKGVDDALESVLSRAKKNLVSQGVAGVVFASGGGWLAIPAGVFTRLVLERMKDLSLASQIIVRSRIEMVQLRLFQQDLHILRGI